MCGRFSSLNAASCIGLLREWAIGWPITANFFCCIVFEMLFSLKNFVTDTFIYQLIYVFLC